MPLERDHVQTSRPCQSLHNAEAIVAPTPRSSPQWRSARRRQRCKTLRVPIASALHHTPVVHSESGVQPPQPRQCAILIRPRKSAIADDVRDQDCSELARFPMAHPLGVTQNSTKASP